MYTKTVHELKSIAIKGLRGFYKLKKADLLPLLLEQLSEEIPTPQPRASEKEGRRAIPVKKWMNLKKNR